MQCPAYRGRCRGGVVVPFLHCAGGEYLGVVGEPVGVAGRPGQAAGESPQEAGPAVFEAGQGPQQAVVVRGDLETSAVPGDGEGCPVERGHGPGRQARARGGAVGRTRERAQRSEPADVHSAIKAEYIHRHCFATRAEARLKIAKWITDFLSCS
ncbi:hypothetical protein CTZ27_11170 [Streptomyces griseocarneus]|nr:hypothetical protein CTZ27_11170 [Streptomyces griseocarneus]